MEAYSMLYTATVYLYNMQVLIVFKSISQVKCCRLSSETHEIMYFQAWKKLKNVYFSITKHPMKHTWSLSLTSPCSFIHSLTLIIHPFFDSHSLSFIHSVIHFHSWTHVLMHPFMYSFILLTGIYSPPLNSRSFIQQFFRVSFIHRKTISLITFCFFCPSCTDSPSICS